MKIILTILFIYFFIMWYGVGLEKTILSYVFGFGLTAIYVLVNVIFYNK